MLLGAFARTVFMAAIIVAQRSWQVPVVTSQRLSVAMSLVIEPERSSTKSKSAGTWVIVHAIVPQFASSVGGPLSYPLTGVPAAPSSAKVRGVPPAPDIPDGPPTCDEDEHAKSVAPRNHNQPVEELKVVMALLESRAVGGAAAAVWDDARDVRTRERLTATAVSQTDLIRGAPRASNCVATAVVDLATRTFQTRAGLRRAHGANVRAADLVGLARPARELVAAAVVQRAAVLCCGGTGLGGARGAHVGCAYFVGLAGATIELAAATVVDAAAILARQGTGQWGARYTLVVVANLAGLTKAAIMGHPNHAT